MSRLTEEVKIRISPEDKDRIKVKMEDAGILNMSAYVRKMALDGICVKLDLQEVRQLIVMLQRCSNNLNQYAKRANETGNIYTVDIEDLQNRLDEIWELSRQSLARLAAIRYRLGGLASPHFSFFRQSQDCHSPALQKTQAPPFPARPGVTAFGSRMRGSTSKMWFKGFGVLPQQAETAVSGNAGNRSFESLWEQRHCLRSSVPTLQSQ